MPDVWLLMYAVGQMTMVCQCQRNSDGWRWKKSRVNSCRGDPIPVATWSFFLSVAGMASLVMSSCFCGLGHGRERDLVRLPSCFDVLDPRGSVHVDLTAALAEQKLDCREIALIEAHVFVKFISKAILESWGFSCDWSGSYRAKVLKWERLASGFFRHSRRHCL